MQNNIVNSDNNNSKIPTFFEGSIDNRLGKWFFSRVSNTVSFLVEETFISFKNDGLYINAIDSSHVAIAMFYLSKDDFLEYEIDHEFKIGINIKNLGKIFDKMVKLGKEAINLEVKDLTGLKINYTTLKTKEIEEYDSKEDNIMAEFETTLRDKWISWFQMKENDLYDQFNSCEVISDLVQIKTDTEKIIFASCNEDAEYEREFGKYETYGNGDSYYIIDSILNDSEGLYSLNFVKAFIKPMGFKPKRLLAKRNADPWEYVTVNIGNSIPAKFELKFLNSKLIMILAPRVEDDEDDDDWDKEYNTDDLEDKLNPIEEKEEPKKEEPRKEEPEIPKVPKIEPNGLEIVNSYNKLPEIVKNQVIPNMFDDNISYRVFLSTYPTEKPEFQENLNYHQKDDDLPHGQHIPQKKVAHGDYITSRDLRII